MPSPKMNPPSRQPAPSRSGREPANRTLFRLSRLLPALLVCGVLAVVLAVAGFSFAATQESHDSFCASCHSQPESTFYQRSVDNQQVDLASFHTAQKTRCIDCHSGAGLLGRMQAELLGARNAVLWNTGQARQPAPLTVPIGDANCLKCHQQVTGGTSRNNHFHGFLARWQATDPKAGGCVSCHPGHATDGNAGNRFQNQALTQAVCNACHAVLRRGGD